MSFMNKVKNFFYEDVEDDEEIVVKEKPKKEVKIDFKSFLKRNDDENIEEEFEETRRIDVKPKANNDLSERELFRAERTFNFPMDLGDEIFDEDEVPTIITKEEKKIEKTPEPVRPVQRTSPNTSSIYRNISTEEPKKQDASKHFRPSPIISPVYGILDKNYTVDDVVEKDLNKTKEFSIEKKSVDFDTVRNRAYKELDEEIEKTLTGDIFYNLDSEEGNVPEEDNNEEFDNDDSVIITYNEEEVTPIETEEEKTIPIEDIVNEEKEEIEPETKNIDQEDNEDDDLIPDVKISPKKETKKSKKKEEVKEEKEDLFNLIDNMYNEEDEEEDE